ncbi:MAG: FG-GAP-like repeat, partial [Humisphaera sp.]|nr:FG-GAP-like repeat [Humisphaera sp.]
MPVTPTCEGLEPRRLFAAALVHQELHRPPSGLLRDFNGDGLDDLAVMTAPSRGGDGIGVDILLNDGKGAFVLVGHTDCDDGDPSADVFAADITLGDVNGDGAPDIVAKLLSMPAHSGDAKATAAVMLNTGKGEFAPGKAMSVLHRLTRGRAHSIVGDDLGVGVADLDGDKFGDIVSVYGDEISITMMSERGPRQTTSFQVSEVTVQGWDPKSKKEFIGLGDLTGDGRPDLVAS